MSITASLTGDYEGTPVLCYVDVDGIAFSGVYYTAEMTYDTLTVIDLSVSDTVTLDTSKLYMVMLAYADENDGNYTVSNANSESYVTFTENSFTGSLTGLSLEGATIVMVYVMIVFYMILLFSSFMRSRMERTRAKMEADGRLYPQGYGRCENCGAIVLPGEVKCRKCGKYIDRPKEWQPEKKDFFECSECGAEVPADAEVCPKCGAKFDGTETEVIHSDGSKDTTSETIMCPECGENLPITSKFCPKCGHRFDE